MHSDIYIREAILLLTHRVQCVINVHMNVVYMIEHQFISVSSLTTSLSLLLVDNSTRVVM